MINESMRESTNPRNSNWKN